MLAFGHNKNFRYIAAHTIAAQLGDDWCKGLLSMHAFLGCDTVSSFCGIGKKTVWDVWWSLPSLKILFGCLSHSPEAITDDYMKYLWFYCTAVLPNFSLSMLQESNSFPMGIESWKIFLLREQLYISM